MPKEDAVDVTYVTVPEEGQHCDGCGKLFDKDELATSLFFNYRKTAARICDDCHESLAEQTND